MPDIESPEEDIENNDDVTIIKGKRGRPTKEPAVKPNAKPAGLTAKDIQQKIFLLYNLVTPFLGKEKQYVEEDFDTEAKSIYSVCEKWPIVARVISMFDPIFIILLLLNKFSRQKNKVAPEPGAVSDGKDINPV
jgi:hypothetical protein